LAVDRDVERVLGLLARALREIVEGGAVLHERDAAVGGDEIVLVRVRRQIFLEQGAVGLVAGGVDVGDVVGDDVHLPFQHHLP
jgi:hypothetical protein